MSILEITINGHHYSLACGEGEEPHVTQLAEEVSLRAADIAAAQPKAGEVMTLVMSALTLADELYEARQESGRLHEKLAETRSEMEQLKQSTAENGAQAPAITNSTQLISEEESQISLAFMMDELASKVEDIAEAANSRAAQIQEG